MKVLCSKCGKDSNNDKVCSNCGYVFKELRKISFKERINNITPVTLKKIEIVGYIGNIIGIIIVCILLIIFSEKLWYLFFAFVFSILIQVSQLISAIQQYNALKKINQIVNIDSLLTKNL